MSFENDFLPMLAETVTVEPYAAFDGYGNETFGTTVVIPARIVFKSSMRRGDREEARVVSATVAMPPPGFVTSTSAVVPLIGVRDHIILPDGTDRRVLKLNTPYDESGAVHHQEVELA